MRRALILLMLLTGPVQAAPSAQTFAPAIQAALKSAPPRCARFPERPSAGHLGTYPPAFANSKAFTLYRAMQRQGLVTIRRGPFQQAGTTIKNAAFVDLTPKGQAAFFSDQLCYGKPVFQQVLRFTPVQEVMGFQTTQVTFSYTLTGIPTWARDATIAEALKLPNLDQPATGLANLVRRGDTWTVTAHQP